MHMGAMVTASTARTKTVRHGSIKPVVRIRRWASMQQLTSPQAKGPRRAINAQRQAGGTTGTRVREMLNLPATSGVLHTLAVGSWQL